MRVASNKKESQNFKDIVFEIVNGEEAQEEINQYSLKVSDMTEEQKEREFKRQAKKAKSVPINRWVRPLRPCGGPQNRPARRGWPHPWVALRNSR